jgi:nucleoside-diphosphate-sugar epimerase
LVGSGLCKLLLSNPECPKIYVLARTPAKVSQTLSGLSGVAVLEGDITAPHLGLSPQTYTALQQCVSGIVHCAADTRFGLPLAAIQAPNVGGTKRILDFARGCRRMAKFLHVSTVYVAGKCSGDLPERANRHECGFFNTYQQSKYEAEGLVFEAMNDLPAMIVRFSSIIGDSRTGEVTRYNYVHQLLRLFPRNVLPIAPGEPEAPVDLIPTEWAVGALAHLFRSTFAEGEVLHLCSGQESLTVKEMMRATVVAFENHPIGRTWSPIQLPELVSLPEFETFVERTREKGDKLFDALITALGYFLPHLAILQSFDNRKATQALAGSGLTLPRIREYYPRVVKYCLETNWVGRRKTGAAPLALSAGETPP